MGRYSSLHRKGRQNAAPDQAIRIKGADRLLTFAHLHLDTGVPFGDIPHTSHYL